MSHRNRVFWLFYSHFIVSYLVYIKGFSVCVQAQIICAKNLSITITPYVFYWITGSHSFFSRQTNLLACSDATEVLSTLSGV